MWSKTVFVVDFQAILEKTSAPDRLALFLDGYLSAADKDGVLTKDDLPLRPLAKLMPDITLFEMMPGDQIIYRLAGQNILDRMGFPLQGLNMLDFVHEADKERTVHAHKDILRYRCGYLMIFQADAPHQKVRRLEAVRLPVRMRRDGLIDGFLGCNLNHSLIGINDARDPDDGFQTIHGELTHFFDIGNGVPSHADIHPSVIAEPPIVPQQSAAQAPRRSLTSFLLGERRGHS